MLNGFDFQNQLAVYDEVGLEGIAQLYAVVLNWDWDLALERDSALVEFVG